MDNRPLKKKIKYSLIYYFVKLLIFISSLIPRRMWIGFCGFLGSIAYYFSTQSRTRAVTHLTVAFGNEKSTAEIKALSKRMFRMLGKNAGEVIRSRNITTLAGLEKIMTLKGLENFDAADAKGKGVLFIASHLGAFDLEVSVMSLRGKTPNIVGTALKDERLNELMFNYRNRNGAVAIERGKETLRLIRALKKGEMVAILIDQDTKVKSRFVDFFGMPAATPVGAAVLALKTGAAAVPVSIYLGEDYRQHMEIFPEIPLIVTGDEEHDMIANTQLYTKFIEDQIRFHPEQWVWMHERWKTKEIDSTRR